MTYTGDGKSLLGGGRGKQRTGAAEQDPFKFSVVQLCQQVTAECDGAAAAAGSACVDILAGIVKHKGAAICQLSTEIHSILSGKLHQQFLTDLAKIAGDD